MTRRSGRLTVVLVTLALVATFGGYARPSVASAGTTPFTDIAGTTFEADIEWLFSEGITRGCTATLYCPDDPVTRGQMASFLVRMFDLVEGGDIDAFTDDDGTTHEIEINKLAASGITVGCTATTFCPTALVRRGEMATFLARAIPLTTGAGRNYFRDDDGTTHEGNIDRLAAAGIASGCAVWKYCPTAGVTRGQMAGFLHRVAKPISPPPYPAPTGPQTLYVAIDGSDIDNGCTDVATPCASVRYANASVMDGDSISIGPGTFAEERLTLNHDMTITGDPGGGTIIDASSGARGRIFTVLAGHKVGLAHLTLTGGDAGEANGGAVLNAGELTITSSLITDNRSDSPSDVNIHEYAGAVASSGQLTITDSTIRANHAGQGAVYIYRGTLNVTGSTISDNVSAGIHSWGSVTVTGSTISGNSGYGVGGLDLTVTGSTINGNRGLGINAYSRAAPEERLGRLTVEDSIISGNAFGGIQALDGTASIAGSTIQGNPGGGINALNDILTVVDTTISGNTGRYLGGIDISRGLLSVTNSTISGNSGGITIAVTPSTITNSTISGNSWGIADYGGSGNPSALDVKNAIVAGNLSIDVSATITTDLASIVGVPAGLTLADILDPAGLADNGGPTKTIALTDSATNPALDHGDAATCAAAPVSGLDQRGLPRTPPCDIGAYELQP